MRTDGILQTYQRGHKAVMNTHTVGGNSDRTRYVGMDQYGNKYYEDFDPLCKSALRQIATSGGGWSTTTTCRCAAPTGT